MKDLKGKVAIVTGGASGIGKATAIALAKAGVKVVVADINEAGAKAAADEIGSRCAIGVRCDVTRMEDFVRLKETALQTFGRIDIVMNNAGVLTGGRPDEIPLEEWQRVLDINLLSAVRSNAVFLPLLIAQGHGHIVNTSSFSGLFMSAFDRLPYAAAKAGLLQMSEGLALYLKPMGIGVTCLCPGPVKTNIMSSLKSFGTGLDMRGPGPQFELMEAEQVGAMVVDAIRNDIFMLPTHPQVRDLLMERAGDWDRFLQKQIDHPHIIVAAGTPGK